MQTPSYHMVHVRLQETKNLKEQMKAGDEAARQLQNAQVHANIVSLPQSILDATHSALAP